MREIAREKRRYGYRRIHILLRREGKVQNHKRTERIYREESLSLKKRSRKRKRSGVRVPLPVAQRPNEVWHMDFMCDSLYDGRRFRTFNIIESYNRECLAIEVATSIPGQRVCRVLDKIILCRGKPEAIICDNGPEFTGIALDQWAFRNKIKLSFIDPGKPIQNAIIESFNGKFRDECLNEHWFLNIEMAINIIENWKHDYNYSRPHSSLSNMSPIKFAEFNGFIEYKSQAL